MVSSWIFVDVLYKHPFGYNEQFSRFIAVSRFIPQSRSRGRGPGNEVDFLTIGSFNDADDIKNVIWKCNLALLQSFLNYSKSLRSNYPGIKLEPALLR